MGLRHAKIVCTLGPATDDVKAIGDLIDAGMDVARLNFSHGTHDEHARRLAIVREAARARGKPIAVLQDLQGPKIRTGQGAPAEIREGATIRWSRAAPGRRRRDRRRIRRASPRICTPATSSAWTTGGSSLRVDGSTRGRVVCAVVQGGALRDRMGVNLPSRRVRLPALTDQDRRDLQHGLAIGVDYVALSFVQARGRHRRAARGVQAGRAPDADRREDRDARGGRQPVGGGRGRRRGDGGARRSGRRAVARAGAGRAEGDHRQLPAAADAGDRRDRDAAVDGRLDAADARRGQRRRGRGVRGRGRRDAVGRDRDRQAPARGVRDDGADHRAGGGEPVLRAAAVGAGAVDARGDRPRRLQHRPRGGRARAGRVHGERHARRA